MSKFGYIFLFAILCLSFSSLSHGFISSKSRGLSSHIHARATSNHHKYSHKNKSNHALKIFQQDEYDIVQRSKNYYERKQQKTKRPIFSHIYDENITVKSETINGRLAMVAFSIGIVNEMVSGKSILEQIGFIDRDAQEIFIFFLVAIPTVHFASNVVRRFT